MRSFTLAAWVFGTCAALVPGAARAQTMAPRAGQAAPAPRPAEPAPVPAPRAARVAPAKPLPPAVQKSAAGKMRVPANLLKLGDSEIIFVGGKQVSAGEVRRDLKAQILHAAGAPTLVRVASRKPPAPSRLPISAEAAAMLAHTHPGLKAPAPVDCTQQPPAILAIEGAVGSGEQLTLVGRCFGDHVGDVKVMGQFPGGNLHVSADPLHPGVTFTEWTNGRIVAALPAVTGSPDQTVAISLITHAEKRESPARQASFTAARERVEVPARLWSPSAHFELMWNTADGTQINLGASNPTPFSVTVNPACYLDTMEANAASGKVTAMTGWADGPPNAATVQVAWQPQRTVTSYWYSVVDDVFESEIFDVKAWASCPVGIAP